MSQSSNPHPDELVSRLSAVAAAVATLKEERAALQESNHKLTLRVAELETSLTAACDQIKDLNATTRALRDEAVEQAEIDQLEEENDALIKERDMLLARVADQEAEIKEFRKLLRDAACQFPPAPSVGQTLRDLEVALDIGLSAESIHT